MNKLNESTNCSKSQKNLYVGLCGTQFVGSDRYAVVITEIILIFTYSFLDKLLL